MDYIAQFRVIKPRLLRNLLLFIVKLVIIDAIKRRLSSNEEPRYGPSPFSLICLLLLKDLCFIYFRFIFI